MQILGTGLPDDAWFYPVKALATTNITLSGLQTVGGVSLADGDRVCANGQTNAIKNGIYTVNANGAWPRSPDANDRTQWAPGVQVIITSGTYAGWVFRCTTPAPIVLELTALTFGNVVTPGGAKTQRSILTSADLPIVSTDQILNINSASPLAITVPAASTRAGAPLTFIDQVGNSTLNRTGSDTFSGLTSLPLTVPNQVYTLMPANDGVNSGYFIT